MAAALRLREESSSEHGPGEPEGEGVNRGASRVAGDKAELIEATAQRGLDNDRRTSMRPRRAAVELPGHA
jgi:hypothetical protein